MAGRGSHRKFQARAVDPSTIRLLCAVALSGPSKSDLQQRDIVIVADPDIRKMLDELIDREGWVGGAPAFLVFWATIGGSGICMFGGDIHLPTII